MTAEDIGYASSTGARLLNQKEPAIMVDESRRIMIMDLAVDEVEEREECRTCNGMGGDDWSTDPEVYDDWHDCLDCDGNGWVELGYFDRDLFIPERDAFTPDD